MSGEARSLLTFVPVPVAVGDPDGRAVYVNPAFAERFGVDAGRVQGRPLGELFAGGGREAVLGATAEVCSHGRETRFRLREAERGYSVLAAPIVAEGQNVGLLFLFWDESPLEGRVRQFHRELQDPLADLAQCLDTLLEQTGGRRAERFRSHVESGLRAAERIRKWSSELAFAVDERTDPAAAGPHFDPLLVARDVGEVLVRAARLAGQRYQQLLPVSLPAVRGDGERLALALTRFATERIEGAPAGSAFTLAAKAPPGDRCVLISFIETTPREVASFALDDETAPASLRAVVDPTGGSVVRVADPLAGVTTTLRLPFA